MSDILLTCGEFRFELFFFEIRVFGTLDGADPLPGEISDKEWPIWEYMTDPLSELFILKA